MDKLFFFLKSSQIYMKDAGCADTNEKPIFRFLVFEIWLFLDSKLVNFWWILSTKSSVSKQIKIGKIWILIFYSIQHCAHLSCKYGHFWRVGVCISLVGKNPTTLLTKSYMRPCLEQTLVFMFGAFYSEHNYYYYKSRCKWHNFTETTLSVKDFSSFRNVQAYKRVLREIGFRLL